MFFKGKIAKKNTLKSSEIHEEYTIVAISGIFSLLMHYSLICSRGLTNFWFLTILQGVSTYLASDQNENTYI